MALRGPFPATLLQKECVLLAFRLQLDAANNPAVVEGTEFVLSVVHNSTGLYTITLRDKIVATPALVPAVEAATAVDLKAQLVAAPSSANSFQVRLLSGATTLTDPPAKGANATFLHGVVVARSV